MDAQSRSSSTLDDTDRRLIGLLRRHPRATVAELARRSGLARNTVQARLRGLETTGVIVGHGPDLDARAAGYPVLAFVTLLIAQGAHDRTVDAVSQISEVLEVHTITGRGDLLLKVASSSNDALHETLQDIAAIPEVARTDTQLALHTTVQRTIADLVGDAR